MKIILHCVIVAMAVVGFSCSDANYSKHESLTSLSTSNPETLNLAPRTFLDGRLTIRLPPDFKPLSEVRLKMKYPLKERPETVMTNDDNSVNIAFRHTQERLASRELEEYRHMFAEKMVETVPGTELYGSKMYRTGRRACFVVDMRTPARHGNIRNILMGTSVDGRLLVVSFNTEGVLEDEWLDTGRCIISSIEIND